MSQSHLLLCYRIGNCCLKFSIFLIALAAGGDASSELLCESLVYLGLNGHIIAPPTIVFRYFFVTNAAVGAGRAQIYLRR